MCVNRRLTNQPAGTNRHRGRDQHAFHLGPLLSDAHLHKSSSFGSGELLVEYAYISQMWKSFSMPSHQRISQSGEVRLTDTQECNHKDEAEAYMVQGGVSLELQLLLHKLHVVELIIPNAQQLCAVPGIEADKVELVVGVCSHQDLPSHPFPDQNSVVWLTSGHDQQVAVLTVAHQTFDWHCFINRMQQVVDGNTVEVQRICVQNSAGIADCCLGDGQQRCIVANCTRCVVEA